MNSTIFFLFLALICVFLESFFSMFEMACVSINKVRLQYFVSKNNKRAIWTQKLLNKPSFLFGTTLIAVNTVMQIGSEAARRFYESINLSPDFAPLSQIIIVLIFGELAPLFAARRHPEHIALLFVPIVYLISKILTPFIWIVDKVSKISNLFFGKSETTFFLTKEELQKAFEEPSKKGTSFEKESINDIVSKIFTLKDKIAKNILLPIDSIKMIDSNSNFTTLMSSLSINYVSYIPIYHKNKNNIVAIAYPKNLLNIQEKEKVINYSKPPWFVLENTKVVDILKQFRTNNQTIAVVLNSKGASIGFITLDQIIDEIFGQYPKYQEKKSQASKVFIEMTLNGDMTLIEFNKVFNVYLHYKKAKTLSDLISYIIVHPPSEGEVIHFEGFEFSIIEISLLGVKKLKVKTLN
ncbi:MAG: Magnesium and cobalt efflux protein CorC [Candidatus Anoxychlamydiales bacterium]|nr:Magnesium and cobalt efflux protein CorC [Candidatus Anoxychlamydiales bacterium]